MLQGSVICHSSSVRHETAVSVTDQTAANNPGLLIITAQIVVTVLPASLVFVLLISQTTVAFLFSSPMTMCYRALSGCHRSFCNVVDYSVLTPVITKVPCIALEMTARGSDRLLESHERVVAVNMDVARYNDPKLRLVAAADRCRQTTTHACPRMYSRHKIPSINQ